MRGLEGIIKASNFASLVQLSQQLELQEFKRGITQVIIDSLKSERRLRNIARKCEVFLKPNTTSMVINSLPIDCEVTIVQQNH